MKRLILLVCITFSAIAVMAQAGPTLAPAVDTLTNTDTARMVIRNAGKDGTTSFQLNYLKISGTPSASIYLQGSIDGVNYATIKGADTAVIANVAPVQTFLWSLPRNNYLYYRLYGVTTGTQSGQIKGFYISR